MISIQDIIKHLDSVEEDIEFYKHIFRIKNNYSTIGYLTHKISNTDDYTGFCFSNLNQTFNKELIHEFFVKNDLPTHDFWMMSDTIYLYSIIFRINDSSSSFEEVKNYLIKLESFINENTN